MRIRTIHRSVPNPAIPETDVVTVDEEIDVDEKSEDEKTTPPVS